MRDKNDLYFYIDADGLARVRPDQGRAARQEPSGRELQEFRADVEHAAEELRLAEGDMPVLVTLLVKGDKAAVRRNKLLPLLHGEGVRELRHPDAGKRAFLLGASTAARLLVKVFGKKHGPEREFRGRLGEGLAWVEFTA